MDTRKNKLCFNNMEYKEARSFIPWRPSQIITSKSHGVVTGGKLGTVVPLETVLMGKSEYKSEYSH